MEHLEAYNRKLLANILPEHVAQHFLRSDKNIDVRYPTIKLIFQKKFTVPSFINQKTLFKFYSLMGNTFIIFNLRH